MKQKDDPIGRWRSKNIVDAITKEATNEIAQKIASKQSQRTIEEDVTDKAEKVVSDCIQSFLRMQQIKITPMEFAHAVKLVHDLHVQHFSQWPKEELVILCSFQNAIIACEQIRMELI